MRRLLSSVLGIALVASATVFATEPELDGVKCVVAPRDAKAEKSTDYKKGKVYFCCGGCLSKFTASPKKFANKANHQLVKTKQYEQKACPISGREVDATKSAKVGGVEVTFCCGGCQGKVASAEGDKKIALVFADAAFKKGFEKKSESDE